MASTPNPRPPLEIVLIGGGHANVFVLRVFGRAPPPGIKLTLIAKELSAPYSGMLPGLVAGHYPFEACHIDLPRLAAFAGACLIQGSAESIDRKAKLVHVAGQPPVDYDLLAIDVGITPDLDDIPGASDHAIAVKPVSEFVPKWTALLERALTPDGPRRIAAIGGGAAGIELILAARHRLLTEAPEHGLDPSQFAFTLFAGTTVLSSHNARAQRLAVTALDKAGVVVIENDAVAAVGERTIRLASGRTFAIDAALVSTKAKAPPWFANTDLPLDRGYLALRPTLQLLDDDTIFAGGDCANVLAHPREKSGVFAVRQGPIVAENLRRIAAGVPAEPFTPQKQFLSLVSLGQKSAIASRGPFAAAGRWAWWLKDRIDRAFVDGFNSLSQS